MRRYSYWANHATLGCGKNAATPEEAIRILARDHGYFDIEIRAEAEREALPPREEKSLILPTRAEMLGMTDNVLAWKLDQFSAAAEALRLAMEIRHAKAGLRRRAARRALLVAEERATCWKPAPGRSRYLFIANVGEDDVIAVAAGDFSAKEASDTAQRLSLERGEPVCGHWIAD